MVTIIKNQLLKHLSRFTKNLSPEQISLSALRGSGELQDLTLDEELLTDLLELPGWVRLTSAKCNRASFRIQWTKLKTVPIVLNLDEVHIALEVCQEPRVMNPGAGGALPVPGKYSYIHKVIDGISVAVNHVQIDFNCEAFTSSVQISRVTVESRTPEGRKGDLRLTRIKSPDTGQLLIFKELEWQSARIEAKAHGAANANLPPLRLLLGNTHCRIVIKKRLSEYDAKDLYGPEITDKDGALLDAHDSFYITTKSLLVLFQIMGVMPIMRVPKHAQTTKRTTFNWISKATLWAYLVWGLECIIVVKVGRERLANFQNSSNKRFDEVIYNIIFLSILIPHFLLPIASWRHGPQVAIFKNMWTHYQLKYLKITGTPIVFPNLYSLTWGLCVFSWGLSFAVILSQHYLQDDFELWHSFAYYHIIAMLDGFCSLWYINCNAFGTASRGLAMNLHKALGAEHPALKVAQYRHLWVDLSHMMQQLGRAYSNMYGIYCMVIFFTTTISLYGALSEILEHGLSYKEMGLFVIVGYCMTLLYIICNEAYHASRKVGLEFQVRLLNVNLGAIDRSTQREVEMFLVAISKNPPIMNLDGFTNINRELFTARGYLETFGYLKKGRPEVGNLQLMTHEHEYEDELRIAIKTLQEFGGIPVTGEIDKATIALMKQKRCGRPDREEDDDEHRRKKRFAVQGEKWKYTNLTWRCCMEYKNSPDGFDFLFLLLEAALGLVAELAQFGSQSHGALLLSLAALVKTNPFQWNTQPMECGDVALEPAILSMPQPKASPPPSNPQSVRVSPRRRGRQQVRNCCIRG